MSVLDAVVSVLASVLSLGDRVSHFTAETPLLGAIPELDSMAVVSVITALEDRFAIEVADDEISADTFATVGALAAFVQQKIES